MATVAASTVGSTTGPAWRKEQRPAVRDPTLTVFPLQRYNALIANTLQVNHLAYETVARAELLNTTLEKMDLNEINDLLMGPTVKSIRIPRFPLSGCLPHWSQDPCQTECLGWDTLPNSKSMQLLLTECTACETHWQLEGTDG